jgi:hypothetical protein
VTDRPDSFNAAFGFFAMVAGAVLAAAVVVLFATVPIWGWLALVTFLLLTGTALLSFTDPDSRAFLAGTLRKSTYTQIYTTLTRRLVMRLWSALCDPAEDRASVPSLFRAALTWRLYDKALLIAVAYPILLPLVQWLVTGASITVGGSAILQEAPHIADQAVTVGIVGLLLLGHWVSGWHRMLSKPISAIIRYGAPLASILPVFILMSVDRQIYVLSVEVDGTVPAAGPITLLLLLSFSFMLFRSSGGVLLTLAVLGVGMADLSVWLLVALLIGMVALAALFGDSSRVLYVRMASLGAASVAIITAALGF